MLHGNGILHFTDGSMYEGEWVENRIVGRGTLILTDGRVHKGEWKDHEFKIIEIM